MLGRKQVASLKSQLQTQKSQLSLNLLELSVCYHHISLDHFNPLLFFFPICPPSFLLPSAIACPDTHPLRAFCTLVAHALSIGCSVVAVPSPLFPLAATDLYQVFETSDVPAGTINIVTGCRELLFSCLSRHLEIAAVWYFSGGASAEQRQHDCASIKVCMSSEALSLFFLLSVVPFPLVSLCAINEVCSHR